MQTLVLYIIDAITCRTLLHQTLSLHLGAWLYCYSRSKAKTKKRHKQKFRQSWHYSYTYVCCCRCRRRRRALAKIPFDHINIRTCTIYCVHCLVHCVANELVHSIWWIYFFNEHLKSFLQCLHSSYIYIYIESIPLCHTEVKF